MPLGQWGFIVQGGTCEGVAPANKRNKIKNIFFIQPSSLPLASFWGEVGEEKYSKLYDTENRGSRMHGREIVKETNNTPPSPLQCELWLFLLCCSINQTFSLRTDTEWRKRCPPLSQGIWSEVQHKSISCTAALTLCIHLPPIMLLLTWWGGGCQWKCSHLLQTCCSIDDSGPRY